MLNSLIHLAFIGPGGPEFIVIMLVLLLMFGAKDAPRIFRKINEMINQIRNTADGFKREIMYGDLNQQSSSPDDTYADDYNHDDGYDYTDEQYCDGEEDAEHDDSNETFREIEKDIESELNPEAEPAVAEEKSEKEDGDVKKD